MSFQTSYQCGLNRCCYVSSHLGHALSTSPSLPLVLTGISAINGLNKRLNIMGCSLVTEMEKHGQVVMSHLYMNI